MMVCKIGLTNWNPKIALLCASMVVTMLNFSERGSTEQWYFNVSTPSSRTDKKSDIEIRPATKDNNETNCIEMEKRT